MTAIVVGVQLPEDNPQTVADDLSELVALLTTGHSSFEPGCSKTPETQPELFDRDGQG